MQQHHIFGTDGVRGRVGKPPMTPQVVMQLAQAYGSLLVEQVGSPAAATSIHLDRPAVVVGTDTRISCSMLEAALQAGFAAAGVDTVLCGVLPTPGVAYIARLRGFQAGVVVSASHNRFEDNGIKLFSGRGDKLDDEVEAAIERRMGEPLACVPSRQLGQGWRMPTAAGLYVDFCKRSLPADVGLYGMRIVIDAANGACHEVATQVFEQLGAHVVVVGSSPTGININEGVGATCPQHLSEMVCHHRADVGIALDGDGDRLVMADAKGRIFDGDQLLYLLALDAQLRQDRCEGVVGTVMSNFGLEQALLERGMGFARADVGDRHVLQMLHRLGWRLGGETSGHILCLDRHTTGDGIIAALQVLGTMRRWHRDLAQLCEGLSLHAQCLISVPLPSGKRWTTDSTRRCVHHAERALKGQGRVLLRASGTEPVVRVMVECPEIQRAARLARALAADVAQALDDLPRQTLSA